jgi:predicted dehydrogenase
MLQTAPFSHLRAGIIGTGFISRVHIEALRRIGVRVTALCGSQNAKTAAEQWDVPHVFTGYDFAGLIAHPAVDVVHITSPNRHHCVQACAALRAGKHVICEKPMVMDSREMQELAAVRARHERQVFAVNYNVRFYPAVLQLRADVAAGRLGKIIHVNGSYMQDWLLKPDDYNWRILPEESGRLRAAGDIGTHWLDAVSFILGDPVQSVFAHLSTFHKERRRPVVEMQTFSNASSSETVPYAAQTEDLANFLLTFANGALGNLAVSQVAAGRKNSIRVEIYGSERSAWWDSEEPNLLRYGNRDGANAESHRAAPGFTAAKGYTDYPPGHAEGFPDTFKMLYRAVYSHIAGESSGPPLYAGIEDGCQETRVCEAIWQSHLTGAWQKV